MKGTLNDWDTQHSQEWCGRIIQAVARIERIVKSDQETLEPILGRLLRPEVSFKTHLAARKAVATLIGMVGELPPQGPTPDDLLESIYSDLNVPLTHRCLLRAVAMDAFSNSYRRIPGPSTQGKEEIQNNSRSLATQTSVFAIPAFGSPQAALYLLSQPKSLARLCSLVENTGFLGPHSVAILSVPISVDALHRVDVLRAIVDLETSAETLDIHGGTSRSDVMPPEKALEVLSRHVPQERGPFVLAGVRVVKTKPAETIDEIVSRPASDQANDPMSSPMPLAKRLAHTMWWNTTISRIIIDSKINATDLIMRPPAAPLRAQTQARALGMINNLYDRLAGRPFVKVEYESVRLKDSPSSPVMLALSAFDHKGSRITTSQPASMFEVGLGEDFQDVLQEECFPNTPLPMSMSRQELLEEFRIKYDGGLPGSSQDTASGSAEA